MGFGARAAVSFAESCKIETFDGVVDETGEMIGSEAPFAVELIGVVVVPGQSAKACLGSVRVGVGA